MKEQLVSFELAKKLEELGFDIPCLHGASEENPDDILDSFNLTGEDGFTLEDCNNALDNSGHKHYLIPTLSLAQKWFRETYNIHIIIKPAFNDYEVGICIKEDGTRDINYLESSGGRLLFKTYELGLEAAELKACKLLKEKKA